MHDALTRLKEGPCSMPSTIQPMQWRSNQQALDASLAATSSAGSSYKRLKKRP
jgi:hypothetical protein